jgi:hypothetical protein
MERFLEQDVLVELAEVWPELDFSHSADPNRKRIKIERRPVYSGIR